MTILNLFPNTNPWPNNTTSGTWSFSVTRDQIIRHAMLDIGALDGDEVPTTSELNDCALKLNMLVKQWCGKMDRANGLKMWQRQRGDLFLGLNKYLYNLGPTGDNWAGSTTGLTYPVGFGTDQLIAPAAAGQPTFTTGVGSTSQFNVGDFCGVCTTNGDIFWSTVLSINAGAGTVTLNTNLNSAAATNAYVYNYTTKAQRPIEVVTCILRDNNNVDTMLNRMTLETYENLPTKTQTGYVSDPTAFYYESQLGNGQLYIDCAGAQDVTKHLHIVYLRESMDFDNPGDAPEYPKHWFAALEWELARIICPMFDGVWSPEMEANRLTAVMTAREQDAETTELYFTSVSDNPYMP